MLSPELLKKIKYIDLKTRHLANEVFTGEYESAFRGQGMEFEEVREYQPGDEIRTIDWNVTARMGHPFVKVYREEREMTVMLLIDGSASLDFGTRLRLKRETAAEIAAVLAYAAIKSSDRVGVLFFSDQVEKFIPPQKGRGHVYRVIQEVLTFKAKNLKTNLQVALDYLVKVLRRRVICFVLSDFFDEGYQRSLTVARRRHDIICLQVYDPLERKLPKAGWLWLEDPETGQKLWFQSSALRFRQGYQTVAAGFFDKKQKYFQSVGVDWVPIDHSRDYVHILLEFFRRREKQP